MISHVKRLCFARFFCHFARFFRHFACETLACRKVFWPFRNAFGPKLSQIGPEIGLWRQEMDMYVLLCGLATSQTAGYQPASCLARQYFFPGDAPAVRGLTSGAPQIAPTPCELRRYAGAIPTDLAGTAQDAGGNAQASMWQSGRLQYFVLPNKCPPRPNLGSPNPLPRPLIILTVFT